jgi:hypothetical protein
MNTTTANQQRETTSGRMDPWAFNVTFTPAPKKQRSDSLRATNKRLAASWAQVLTTAEANTKRLTGQSRF